MKPQTLFSTVVLSAALLAACQPLGEDLSEPNPTLPIVAPVPTRTLGPGPTVIIGQDYVYPTEEFTPYPGPYPGWPSPTPRFTPQSCDQAGTWATYTAPDSSFSLQYPAESPPREGWSHEDQQLRSLSFRLMPHCYIDSCSGSTSMLVLILNNPERLAVRPFTEQYFRLYTDPYKGETATFYEQHSQDVVLAGLPALRLNEGLSDEGQPLVLIAHEDMVFLAGITVNSKGMPGPFPPPCYKTMELFDTILNSLQFPRAN